MEFPKRAGRDLRARPRRSASLRFALAGAVLLALAARSWSAEGMSPAADAPLRLARSWQLSPQELPTGAAPAPTHRLRLEMAMMRDAGWQPEVILEATRAAVGILAQCGIQTTFVELREFDGPARYRYLETPVSRELARLTRLARPAVYFVADTHNQPAFDAEAIGRGNSRARPEMTDTVWITAGTRDLANVLAHELAHVIANSGEHSDLPGNLMRAETAPESTALTESQCRRLTEVGTANGLLQPAKP